MKPVKAKLVGKFKTPFLRHPCLQSTMPYNGEEICSFQLLPGDGKIWAAGPGFQLSRLSKEVASVFPLIVLMGPDIV